MLTDQRVGLLVGDHRIYGVMAYVDVSGDLMG